ncbi:MAG: hypothetical protein IT443_12570 [Phycisphaeraceae bacterium]|nr:hypothetical protein [Phycisphaeraceae bacterium]
MRLIIDTLILVMLVGWVFGWMWFRQQTQQEEDRIGQVQQAMVILRDRTSYYTAMAAAEADQHTAVDVMSEAWFTEGLPRNGLVSASQPWLDIAPMGDEMDHPPDPVITGPTQAGFWYNPKRHVFRARVLPQLSDQATLELYNQVNATMVRSLAALENAQRKPVTFQVQEKAIAQSATTDQKELSTPSVKSVKASQTTETQEAKPASIKIRPRLRPTLVGADPKR